jgi:threonylcarbamoyladenosine tRNA methylthiotransferase MtaB
MNSIVVQSPDLTSKPALSASPAVMISTMGCKVNTFESELVMQKLTADQYRRVEQVEQADIFLINTCTVTTEADRQARQQVRRAIRANPDAWVVVTGCYAQIDPEACASIPGVDLVVGNSQKLDIPELLAPMIAGKLPPVMVSDIDKEISLPDELISGFEGRTRAFVQIQQGCDQGCTFCIIHTARGPNRSFSPTSIKRQVERLVINGYAEIVICGVDIGSYGSDFGSEYGLPQLISMLSEIEGDFRLRLSSIDPVHISDSLIQILQDSEKVCPQLHLSMQSGNTLILKRMKRRATREVLYERINALRDAVPGLVLSADIMVGFPTEEEAHFQQTLDSVHELQIPFPHVFSYSARPGTPAARIPRQIPNPVRKARAALVRQAGQEVWAKVANTLVGKRLRVLWEGNEEGGDNCITGRAANYYKVKLQPSPEHFQGSAGTWQNVEITGVGPDSLIARSIR